MRETDQDRFRMVLEASVLNDTNRFSASSAINTFMFQLHYKSVTLIGKLGPAGSDLSIRRSIGCSIIFGSLGSWPQ
jgi:hypothetical protein